MRMGFYPKLALRDIRKNRRLFLPYILTCSGMTMMFYIIMYMGVNDVLTPMKGADTLRQVFALGSWVIAVFSAIFLFYTNSFLMRRRKKEFGLYNILGMGKGNIARILFWETLLIALLSIGAGLLGGILFSKLAELGLVNLIQGEVTYDLSISFLAVKRSVQVFGVIFVILFLSSLFQIRFSSAVSLLRSESAGEKPPRGNFFFGLAGVVLLAAAYWIAVTTKDPLSALLQFFFAVLMVILGTYLLMIAGSVLFCRLLQKNKNYYYRPNHFVSVSSMVYRMKRNGAGLASICILATMTLVTMASTTCLYFGEESVIRRRYPREINLYVNMGDASALSDENIGAFREELDSMSASRGARPENVTSFRAALVAGLLRNGEVETDVTRVGSVSLSDYANLYSFYFIPLSDYNAFTGQQEVLQDGEAIACVYQGEFSGDSVSFRGGQTFQIVRYIEDIPVQGDLILTATSSMALVVPDLACAVKGLDRIADFNGDPVVTYAWQYNFDTGLDREGQIALCQYLTERFRNPVEEDGTVWTAKYGDGVRYRFLESQEEEREDFYGMFGVLFYIGVLLSIVFTIAAVLIIYYKQISEGYEDQARFEVMQKVGMTKREIRRSINSQLLTVFFLPLVFAALHLTFAFPLIQKILLAFGLDNVRLFAVTTAVCLALFALFYTVVYRLTANAYYAIVSGAREEDQ